MPKIYLNVPFTEKEAAKLLGARWDPAAKQWFLPDGYDPAPLAKWLPKINIEKEIPAVNLGWDISEKGIPLSQLLQRVSQAVTDHFPNLEWIKAEIGELRELSKNGYLYPDLVEIGYNQQILCKAKAIVSKSKFQLLSDKFQKTTGDVIKAGIKLLVLVKVSFHVQYGLTLYIEDIDPSYTLGDMEAKLRRIRESLQKEGIYNLNKQLIMPSDFSRIAVISPNAAAGLGDFKREADLLTRHRLCYFHYYVAQFQGAEACVEIGNALHNVIHDHKTLCFDAVVIIRGGGAAIDLAWLNDYNLAKLICEYPLLVISGIGHERDNTILDEVANRKFDTPSKVVGFIFNVVSNNAQLANENFEYIKLVSNKILEKSAQSIDKIFINIHHRANNCIHVFRRNLEKLYILTLNDFNAIVNFKSLFIKSLFSTIISELKHALDETNLTLQNEYLRVCDASRLNVNNFLSTIFHYGKEIYSGVLIQVKQTEDKLSDLERFLTFRNTQICDYYFKNLREMFEDIKYYAKDNISNAESLARELIAGIVSLGPKNTLKRGFAVIHDQYGTTISSKQRAKVESILQIQFYDGHINTKVIEE